MQLSEYIRLWNYASVKVMDIRYQTLAPGDSLRGYRLPACAFLVAAQGGARATLDEREHHLDRFHILHGGCGARLDIEAEERFEWYFIFYKNVLTLPPSRKFKELAEENKPFQLQYGFKPLYPLPLRDKVALMFEQWLTLDPLHQFHARTLFYQFMHELLWQLHRQGVEPVRPDLPAQAVRYLREHYMEPVTLESMAELFGCSPRHLNKLFRNSVNESPIRYLTHIRMEEAARLLLHSDMVQHEIAVKVGYPDAYSLNRSFKKYYGMPPARFKNKYKAGGFMPKLPKVLSDIAIVAPPSPCYSDKVVSENRYHNRRGGGLPVYQVRKSTSMTAATLLLAMTLLLAACSGGNAGVAGNANGGGSGASASSVQTAEATSEPASTSLATRTYVDPKGISVEIPANPQRIIDLTGSAIGNLLELGLRPVGATNDALKSPFHEGMLDGVVDLGDGSNAEAMLSLEPDLIIVFEYLGDEEYEMLSKIAPVARLSYGTVTPSELLLEFGQVTGKEAEAQAWVDEWSARIAEVKPRIQEAVGSKTVSILQPHAKGIYAWGNKGGRGGEIIYGDLGLKAPTIIQEKLIDGGGYEADISMEQLPEYSGDFIFTSNWGGDDGDPNVVYGSGLWKGLPAVKNNQVYFINEDGAYYNDPISLEAQLDFIVKSFLGQ